MVERGSMMGIYNAVAFTESLAQVDALLTTANSDEIADRIERIAHYPDLAMATLMILVLKARGLDTSQMNGVELSYALPTVADLVFPPGFERG